ncbi:MAG: hypothetical protein LH467_10220 [Gemmatimonadaceae bacterium]|nr:hypothetical protein [Gemmatimonadaceae bacterium]
MRSTLFSSALLLAGLAGTAAGQSMHGQHTAAAKGSPNDATLILNALSAGPASVTAGATVMNHDGRVLRKGTNDWVCMPDMPDRPNNTPMCLDAPWRVVIDAWVNKKIPTVSQVGFAYMLQGDIPVSNTDPYATGLTATNDWIQHGDPHIMVLIPDQKLLDGMSTDPTAGGPFVMWKGTPYAHIMLPGTPPPKPKKK